MIIFTGTRTGVVTVAIPKPTETDDLGPHDMGSVHPVIHMSLRAFFNPRISLFVKFTQDVCGPIRQFVVEDEHLGPTSLAEGSEYSALCFLSSSSWYGH